MCCKFINKKITELFLNSVIFIYTKYGTVSPWALKAGRVATRPMLQFYYVMEDDNTSTLDRVLIYATIIYTILPMDFIPSVVYKFLGVLDDGVLYYMFTRK